MAEPEKKTDADRADARTDDSAVEGHSIAEESDDEVAQFSLNIGCS